MLRLDVPPVVDAEFREVPTPGAIGSGLKLPARIWVGLGRLRWRLGWTPGIESLTESGLRADRATALLESTAAQHGSVLLAGHGIMNGLIGRRLRRAGWRGPKHRGRHFRAVRIYEKG